MGGQESDPGSQGAKPPNQDEGDQQGAYSRAPTEEDDLVEPLLDAGYGQVEYGQRSWYHRKSSGRQEEPPGGGVAIAVEQQQLVAHKEQSKDKWPQHCAAELQAS